MDRYEHVEELLKRFFEGETTNTEEQCLYEFFAGKDIPEHLTKYKPVFVYFNEGIKEELCEMKAEVPVRRMQNKKWILWSCAAAVLLVLVLLNPFAFGGKPFDPYEGSYIVRNGVRITDPETIRPELEAIIQQVMQQQQAAKSLSAKFTSEDNRYTDVDKIIQDHYESMLERFENEDVRNEVKKVLKSK